MLTTNNKMTYKFLRNDQWEEVMPEVWCWVAEYNDGTVLKQFGDDGIFHQFKDIDQSKLKTFKMVSEGKPDYVLVFNPEKMKLIFFYRKARLNMGAENETFVTLYCFGYEVKILGRTAKTMMVIMPNGEVVITEDIDLIEIK